jgi:RNA polymerase sigma-70 factor (ECF subfamily)
MTFEQGKTHNIPENSNCIDSSVFTIFTANVPHDIITQLEVYRGELLLHCYRLLGSPHDAEDLVQETLLRAWQRFDTFKGLSSLRVWLYTIATNVCLDALKKRPTRTLPPATYPVTDPHSPIIPPTAEACWLEPFPDSWLAEGMDNPEARYTRYESVSLAFLTVLQLLPPRQRAILLLSDVLDWHMNEIASLLDTSVSAANSALRRARVTIAKHYHSDKSEESQINYTDAETSALLDRYLHAWETDDVAGLVALLKEEATLCMPPFPSWYQGRESIRTLLSLVVFRAGEQHQWRLYLTRANREPAFVLYRFDASQGVYQAFGIQVVTLDYSTASNQIAAVTIFNRPSLVTAFNFPLQQPDQGNHLSSMY